MVFSSHGRRYLIGYRFRITLPQILFCLGISRVRESKMQFIIFQIANSIFYRSPFFCAMLAEFRKPFFGPFNTELQIIADTDNNNPLTILGNTIICNMKQFIFNAYPIFSKSLIIVLIATPLPHESKPLTFSARKIFGFSVSIIFAILK